MSNHCLLLTTQNPFGEDVCRISNHFPNLCIHNSTISPSHQTPLTVSMIGIAELDILTPLRL